MATHENKGIVRVLDRAGEQETQNPVNQAQVVSGIQFASMNGPKVGKNAVNLEESG